MQGEIDQRRRGIFDRRKTLVELARRKQALQKRFRYRLACLMMQGETAQYLRLLQPMFVKLRRKFDEIAGDVGARDQRIGHIGQHAVQGIAEIQDIDDDRPDLSVELLLLTEGTHPGAATFRGPREIIADKKCDLLSVAR